MLEVNEALSGVIGGGIGEPKFRVTLESEDREELESTEAKRLALNTAEQNGFAHAGLTEMPTILAISSETNEPIMDFAAGQQISHYRAEFTVSRRL